MPVKPHNPEGLFPQYGNYHHGVEVTGDSRLLFLSGLNGFQSDGVTMPESFDDQAELIWTYMGKILASADMDYGHIVSLRIYLASPDYDEANMRIRKKFMGERRTALTVICCQLLEPGWKIEIEAVAAS